MLRTASNQFVFARRLLAFGLGCGVAAAWAQVVAPLGTAAHAQGRSVAGQREPGISEWLMRMHEASRLRSYVGTFVVSVNSGGMSAARIWHACDGGVQVERVEALTGPPRWIFRRDEQVTTFLPEAHVVRTEKRESLGIFTDLLKSADSAIPEFYAAKRLGADRVAGFETDVVQLTPKDNLRFGYRIWSEARTGLVIKLQTLDVDGSILEQSAFSELSLDAPVRADKLARMMPGTDGWRVERAELVKTTPESEGWQLRTVPAGFRPISCYKRSMGGAPLPEGTMQWIFSDGLAAVSLFVEAYDRRRHVHEGLMASGATQTLTRRIHEWWLTAVGEVPSHTLGAFAQGLERRR